MAVMMSKDVIKTCLRTVSLFADLTADEMDLLAASSRDVAFRKGARIFEEGAAADCCFVMTAGRARVVLAGDSGTEILLHVVAPPALVGEIALLDRSTRSASLVAVEPCHFIRIPAATFEQLRTSARFEQRLVALLVSRLREADDRVRVITSFPSINRVAWCLARLARYTGRREGATITIPKTPHSELAEMAGCTRETVTRTLQILRRKKYVTWNTSSIVLDIEGMQRYLGTELTVPAGAAWNSH
jgi:CRP-like cAMP-binding protein